MPFTLRAAVSLAVVLAAACSSSSSGSVTPGGPNPSSTTVTVTTSKGARLADYYVTLSRGVGSHGPTGIIDSQRTDSVGQVTFDNLPSAGQLCVYTSTTIGGILYKVSHCAQPFPKTYTLKFGPKGP